MKIVNKLKTILQLKRTNKKEYERAHAAIKLLLDTPEPKVKVSSRMSSKIRKP